MKDDKRHSGLTEVQERKVQYTLTVTRAVADAIRSIGSVPSGHLYANVMHVVDLESYEQILSVLVSAKLVRRDGNHLLTWIGK